MKKNMEKNRFFTAVFSNLSIFTVLLVLILFNSCASKPVAPEGIQGKSYNNPNVIEIYEKKPTNQIVIGGEFCKFEFKGFKKSRFGIIEVLNKSGERISLYSIGYSKNHFYDTFFISPNAAKINVAVSNRENYYDKIKQSFVVETSDLPIKIYDGTIVAGDFNTFDFTAFSDYYSSKLVDSQQYAADNKTFGIIESLDEWNRVVNQKYVTTDRTGRYLVPAKTKTLRLSISGSREGYYTPIDIVSVSSSPNPITIKSFVSSSFRNLDLNIYQKNIKEQYGIIEYLDSNYQTIFRDYVKNDGNGKLAGKVFIPQNAVHANIAVSNRPLGYTSTIDYIDILPSTNSSALKSPDSFFEANKYRNQEINAELTKYIKYLDLRALRNEPEVLIEFLADKINQLAKNDFEKVKLYHDATVLLLNYKEVEDEKLAYGDYSVSLKRGVGTSYDFCILFTELCRSGDIKAISTYGNVKKLDHVARSMEHDYSKENNPKKFDFSQINHWWNIVFINGDGYFVDCALDAVEIDFPGKRKTDWFLVPAEEFIKSHRPVDSEFQLLSKPVLLEEYRTLPYEDFDKKLDVPKKAPVVVEEEVELSDKELKKLARKAKKEAKAQAKIEEKEAKQKAKLEMEHYALEDELKQIEIEQRKLNQKIEKRKAEQKSDKNAKK